MSGGKIYKLIDSLNERLNNFVSNQNKVNFNKNGIIFGFNQSSDNNCTFLIGCAETIEDIPFGNQLIGAYFLEQLNEESIIDFSQELAKDKKSGKLLILQKYESSEKTLLYDIKTKKLSESSIVNVNYSEPLESLVQIQLDYFINLKFAFNENCCNDFENLFKTNIDNLGAVNFRLDQSNFQMDGNNVPKILVEDLYNQIEEFDELADIQIPANMKKKMIEKSQRQLRAKKSTLHFKLKTNLEKSIPPKNLILEQGKQYDFNIEIKTFYNLQLQNNVQQLHKIFVNSLTKILTDMKKIFIDLAKQGKNEWSIPQVANFYDPPFFTHIITTIFQDINLSDQYKIQREKIHLKYLIPMNAPTFKLNNALGYSLVQGNRLMNVHIGLNSGVKNGQCAIVKGKYFYFHYNQDHIDDSGWGCAYRSLQTIISWFQLQGYIEIESVPTHKDIQQALIDVGDKLPNFLGSSKWIGSQEVCYVLSHLYDIQSKIIFINSATELLDKARDLIRHFQTNGTPIMIGGGVLAHTIIGVDFDENTGEVKYLVLDPHYIGDEDINNIHKKGGCAWKPVTFWDKNSFYNLCLPQVPKDY